MSADEDKQSLLDQQRVGDALREVQNHQGWREVVNILSTLYQESVVSLIEQESVEVRARLKAIEDLATQIKLKIDFGNVAADELKTAKFQTMSATPDS